MVLRRILSAFQRFPLDPRLFSLIRNLSPPLNYTAQFCRFSEESFQVVYAKHGIPLKVVCDRLAPLRMPVQSEVLVKMLVAPINPSDLDTITGFCYTRLPLPAVAGSGGVGTVIAVGPDVISLKEGDRVIPRQFGLGTWRTFLLAEETALMKIPSSIPLLSAATLAINPFTAYRMMNDFTSLRAGEVLIQNGANSSVGQAVIQLARNKDLVTVNIVRDRPDLDSVVKSLKELGATHVITDKFSRSKHMKFFVQSLPAPPRLALNCVGGRTAADMMRHLADNSYFVTYGGMSRKPVVAPAALLIFKQIQLVGYWHASWHRSHGQSREMTEMLEEICDLIQRGRFLPPPCDIYTVDMYRIAVRAAMERFRSRKVLLKIDDDLKLDEL